MSNLHPITILLADPNPDDRLLTKHFLAECRVANDLRMVEDDEQLMAYLRRQGKYCTPESSPSPGLILLDLHLPRKNGHEALREIKSDPTLKEIPVVVLTTSDADQDVVRSYDLGVRFMNKPVSLAGLLNALTLAQYWIEIVALPQHLSGG